MIRLNNRLSVCGFVKKSLILAVCVRCLFDKNTGASDRKEALTRVRLERHAWTSVMGVTVPHNGVQVPYNGIQVQA
jgi:hypothetical protein